MDPEETERTLSLNGGELLALDWVTCAHGDTITAEDVAIELMDWSKLRERIWRGIIRCEIAQGEIPAQSPMPPPPETDFVLSEHEAAMLLGMVPTTFRWGPGEDVGFSLKLKIAQLLWGGEEHERHTEAAQVATELAAIFGPITASTGTSTPTTLPEA